MALVIWETCERIYLVRQHGVVLMGLRARIGSYAWKAEWGPNYHQSMFIGLGSLAFSTVLAFGMLFSASLGL